jgi:hypothetical protein
MSNAFRKTPATAQWGGSQLTRLALSLLAVLMGATEAGVANTVRLELRPTTTAALVGDQLQLDLYAISDGELDVELSVLEVILTWDPAILTLVGNIDPTVEQGGYVWLSSLFPLAGDLGLNQDLADGDALYLALSQLFGASAFATSEGLHVTSFVFTVDATTPGTPVDLPETLAGSAAETSVIGDIPNFNILSSTTGASVTAIACSAEDGDGDLDGDVDLADFQLLQACYSGTEMPATALCRCSFDLDDDTDIDRDDLNGFTSLIGGPSSG